MSEFGDMAYRELIAEKDVEIERLREDTDLALREATRLLESFVVEHCSPIPDWKPLPDLIGVLSQLSNAVTVTRDLKAEIERLRAADALREAAFSAYAEQERKDRAKIERLQAALKAIVDRYETAEHGWPAEDMREMARRALDGEKG